MQKIGQTITPGWLRTKQAAEYACIKERTLRSWLKMGLKCVRINGSIFIHPLWIDSFILGHSEYNENALHLADDIFNDFNGSKK